MALMQPQKATGWFSEGKACPEGTENVAMGDERAAGERSAARRRAPAFGEGALEVLHAGAPSASQGWKPGAASPSTPGTALTLQGEPTGRSHRQGNASGRRVSKPPMGRAVTRRSRVTGPGDETSLWAIPGQSDGPFCRRGTRSTHRAARPSTPPGPRAGPAAGTSRPPQRCKWHREKLPAALR